MKRDPWVWLPLLLVSIINLLTPEVAVSSPFYNSDKIIAVSIGDHNREAITLIYPERLNTVGVKIGSWLQTEYNALKPHFGSPEGLNFQVQLMDHDKFFKETGLPSWTNAIYFDSQIILPINLTKPIIEENLRRALRHELVHVFVDHLSNGRCPGWLDEGLAQLLEGQEHPALHRALENWLENQQPIPFNVLQTGFTRLSHSMVPAAYAQSFFTANVLVETQGYDSFNQLFLHLKQGQNFNDAFKLAFKQDVYKFEENMAEHLTGLVKDRSHGHHHPPKFNNLLPSEVRASPARGIKRFKKQAN